MSNVAVLRGASDRASAAIQPFLGPAEVTEILGPLEVSVRLPDGSIARARLALAFAYEPRPSDVLLVIGNPDGHYVIGVLQGTGKASLSVPGDVEVRAVGGELVLAGDKGVRVEGGEVRVRAGKLEMLAGAVAQRFGELRQHVADLWSVRAGQAHAVIEGSTYQQSKSATILTEEKVTINGRAIHLG
jgi:hypothetical protein